ncbi:MAG: hypothetical protein Tsb004_30180 [Allomuricauda sp.]
MDIGDHGERMANITFNRIHLSSVAGQNASEIFENSSPLPLFDAEENAICATTSLNVGYSSKL